MRKKNKWMKLIGVLLIAAMALTGCGGASKYAATESAEEAWDYATDDIYMHEMPAEEAVSEEAETETGMGDGETPKVQDTERKLIKTVSMDVETETFDILMQTIQDKVAAVGGYIQSSDTYNGSHYYGESSRNAELTLRIPAENLDAFLATVSDNSNVISRNENVEDVTLQYVDMKSRKEALETEHDRLLELLERAETVEDIITIEGRLSEVRYEMESMEAQLRTLENQVSYSTVHLYINEVVKYTPVKELSTWEKIKTGFSASLYDVGRSICNFVIDLIINIPYIVVWAIIITVAVIIFKIVRKYNKKGAARKEERRLKKEAKKAAEEAVKHQETENKMEQ